MKRLSTEAVADIKRKFDEDPDFVNNRAAGDSLAHLIARYPRGIPPHIRAAAAGLFDADGHADTGAEEREYAAVVRKVRDAMGVTDDDISSDDPYAEED